MSDNFKGITFPWQEVTPSDDAAVRRAIFPDRRLSGCNLSYAGSTLTMTSGYLMVCGRQFRHTATKNWTVSGATSGYARLLLTIDVSKASTKDTFEQISTSIEYATSANGFSALKKEDINGSGVVYQTAICVVSLSTGGISGFYSSLPQGSLTHKDLGAAPSGYGVGEYSANFTALANANDATLSGKYKIDSSTVNGIGVSATMEVIGFGNTLFYQFAFPASSNNIKWRQCISGNYSDWEPLVKQADIANMAEADVLWKNSTPTSSFAAQAVPLKSGVNLNNYNFVEIVPIYDINNNRRLPLWRSNVSITSDNIGYMGGHNPSDGVLVGRTVSGMSATTISFAGGYKNGSENNQVCIPYIILGFKIKE